jgi:hypothetical protein
MQSLRVGLLGLLVAACGGRFDGDNGRSGSSPLDGASSGGTAAPGGSASTGKPSGGSKTPSQGTTIGASMNGGTATGSGSGSSCSTTLPDSRTDYEAPVSCSYVEGEALGAAANVDELNQMLIGQWLLCGFPSAWGTEDEVGVEITPEMTWHKLLLDGSGGLVPSNASGAYGTVQELDDGGYMQVNFETALGTVITIPQFARGPLKMRLENNGVLKSDYVKNDASGLCVDGMAAPPSGPYTAPSSCSQASTTLAVNATVEAGKQALVGRWQTCGGSIFYPPDDVGFELHADGTFQKLYTDEAGDVYAGHGFEREGSYEILDDGDYLQLNLSVLGSGTVILLPQFQDEPRGLFLDNNGVFQARYVYTAGG